MTSHGAIDLGQQGFKQMHDMRAQTQRLINNIPSYRLLSVELFSITITQMELFLGTYLLLPIGALASPGIIIVNYWYVVNVTLYKKDTDVLSVLALLRCGMQYPDIKVLRQHPPGQATSELEPLVESMEGVFNSEIQWIKSWYYLWY